MASLLTVGFTGTQEGMVEPQIAAVRQYLEAAVLLYRKVELHHGDCIGADAQAHALALRAGCTVALHPPTNPRRRAYCAAAHAASAPLPYLERNKVIVRRCDVLLATPKAQYEELRSGTWSTIRFARRLGKRIHIYLP